MTLYRMSSSWCGYFLIAKVAVVLAYALVRFLNYWVKFVLQAEINLGNLIFHFLIRVTFDFKNIYVMNQDQGKTNSSLG